MQCSDLQVSSVSSTDIKPCSTRRVVYSVVMYRLLTSNHVVYRYEKHLRCFYFGGSLRWRYAILNATVVVVLVK